jgi:hypothetical protein
MLNKDVEPTKVRADPLTGYISCIYVNGDFHDSYNLFAIICANPQKIRPVAYAIGCDNGLLPRICRIFTPEQLV